MTDRQWGQSPTVFTVVPMRRARRIMMAALSIAAHPGSLLK